MSDPAPDSLRIRPDNYLWPIAPARHWPQSDRPLEVDVGSGKGRFLLARAARYPETNFLGIDRMLGRLNKTEKKALRRGLHNIRLLRFDAYYAVTYLLPPAAVNAYYVFFPDPWPKERHHHHRLFNAPFLDAVARTLQPGGALHVATDHLPYFEEIEAILANDPRLTRAETFVPAEDERTDFELLYLGRKPIGRASFRRAE